MSRQIDISDPESLTSEDQQYLADRYRTVEQEAERQALVNSIETAEGRASYLRRVGGPAFGDPILGQVRKARQL